MSAISITTFRLTLELGGINDNAVGTAVNGVGKCLSVGAKHRLKRIDSNLHGDNNERQVVKRIALGKLKSTIAHFGKSAANDVVCLIAFASHNCKLHLRVVGNFLLVHSLKPPSKILCHVFLESVAVAIAQVNQPFGRECEKQMPDDSFVYGG